MITIIIIILKKFKETINSFILINRHVHIEFNNNSNNKYYYYVQ